MIYIYDLTQGSDMVGRLQNLINVLELFGDNWGLQLNMDKTKIIVFRNGGKLNHNEKWYYKGKTL
jgi:hypothetical protein